MKLYKHIIIFIFCVFYLIGCSSSAINEKALISLIPDELLHYNLYDFVQYKYATDQIYSKRIDSKIDSVKITRQQNNGKTSYTECKVILKDTYLTRTLSLGLYLNYYDKGGWYVDNWTLLSSDVPIINTSYDINLLKKFLASEGYNPVKDEIIEYNANTLHYVGDISSGSFRFLNISGQVDAIVFLEEEVDGYSWRVDYTPDLKTQWNIMGNWYGEPHSFSYSVWEGLTIWPGKHYITIKINNMFQNTISGTIEDKYDADGGGIGSYDINTNDNVSYFIEKTGPETKDILLVTTFNAGYHSFDLAFGADEAFIRFHYFTSMPSGYTGNEWAKLMKQ